MNHQRILLVPKTSVWFVGGHQLARKFNNPRPKRKIRFTQPGTLWRQIDFADRPTSHSQMEAKMKSVLSPLMLSATALGAAPAVAQDGARNIVLVHGAFADETSWDKVAGILSAKGYTVTQVANPLTSLADDVAATRAALAAQDGPTVLVAHSWGGVVIGEAGNDEKVKALVYVSAFAPDRGESLNKLLSGGEPSEGARAIRPDARAV